MEFCYNNFGSELLDDDGGDILLLGGPFRLRSADLKQNRFCVLWTVQVYTRVFRKRERQQIMAIIKHSGKSRAGQE